MTRVIAALSCLVLACSLHAQPYLIKNAAWQQIINANNFLAPLFYGVTRQPDRETVLKQELITRYGSTDSAYRQLLINGWNELTIGNTDSAIINFNQAYLIDTLNLENFIATGTVITLVDGNPGFDLIKHYNLDKRVQSAWDATAFFGDPDFIDELKKIGKTQLHPPNLARLLANPQRPYFVDSAKNIMLKIKAGDSEGFYTMGRRSGAWTDYYVFTNKPMRRYTIVNGFECGQITGYHKNGKIMSRFSKNAQGQIDGEDREYDDNGRLIRIDYWHNNTRTSSKIIK